jgi:hypothetical protein
MNNCGVDSPSFRLLAGISPQTRIVLWPRNRLGEYATIAELMSETVQLLEVYNNHHDPHFSLLRE